MNFSASTSGPSGYRGLAFHRQFEGGIAPGRILPGPGAVYFESDSGQSVVELPLRGLTVRPGGASGDQIYLIHSEFPDWTLTTPDHSILKDPLLLADPDVARQVRKFKRGQKLVLIGCLGLLVALVAGIAALVVMREAIVTLAARQLPPQWEAKMGEAAFAQIKQSITIIEDPALTAELKQMTEPLMKSLPDEGWVYRIYLAQDPDANAFALPGGIIVVTSGLIQAAERPEEVLGVLAHEIAHVTQRHGTRQLISRAGLWMLLQAAAGDVQGLLGYLVDGGAFLLTQSYSRDYEREADDGGWEYLVKANLDPSGMLDFFRRMKELEAKSGGARVPAVLSTHPATDERIEWLESKWEKRGRGEQYQRPPTDFPCFKERLSAL